MGGGERTLVGVLVRLLLHARGLAAAAATGRGAAAALAHGLFGLVHESGHDWICCCCGGVVVLRL